MDRVAEGRSGDSALPEPCKEAFSYYRPLRRVKRYVQSRRRLNVNLGECARVAALERTYFSRYFRQRAGVSFRDWILLLRIRRACELLEQEDRGIHEIAVIVGYSSHSAFTRAFKQLMGTTPSSYRSQNHNGR